MKRALAFLKRETVLTVAWVLALVSMVLVPPDSGYRDYIDFDTLMLLFSLMAVMAGLQNLGLFRRMGEGLLARTATTRQLEGALIFLPFFTSMAVNNDVSLITFVPFALEVLTLAGREERLIPVVVMQTIAANLGSMTTPIGNPQNLYLYSRYGLGMGDFLSATLPLWLLSLLAVLLLSLRLPKARVEVFLGEAPCVDKKGLGLYLALFLLCLLAVLRLLAWPWMLGILVLVLLVLDRRRLRKADFLLLLTFVCFFVFSGNLARIGAVEALLRRLLAGRELLTAALTSQVISNVPAALLLSGFTEAGRELLLGVNIGGLGTPVASLASLISLKLYAHSEHTSSGKFLGLFSLVNFSLLALLLGLYQFVL